MDMIANSGHVAYDGGLSLEKNIPVAYKDASNQVCEHFDKACAVEEKLPTPQGFDPNIASCRKNSEEIGASKVSIQDIFLKLFKAGALDVVGGAVQCNKSCKLTQKAARFAVEEYNKIQGHNLELKEVVDAKWQMTCGDLYYLVLEATNGCFFNTEVMLPGNGPPVLLLFKHAPDYVKDN